MIEMKNTPFDIPIFDLTGKVAIITGSTTGWGMVWRWRSALMGLRL